MPFIEPPAVEVRGLKKSYRDVYALQGIDLTVQCGSIHGILGPNGAGKTTLVSILTTLTEPSEGTARVSGYDVISESADVRRSLSSTGQFASVDTHLSGRSNLVLFGRLRGLSRAGAKVRADELLADFSLSDAAKRKVENYSGGMRRRLDIACGLVVIPRIVILDEPTTGLDPRSRHSVWQLIRSLRDRGVTVLLTSQYLDEVDLLSDRVTVIDKGLVVAEGTVDELKELSGPTRCDVVPADPADIHRAKAVLVNLGAEIADTGDRLLLPSDNPQQIVPTVLRILDSEKIAVADVSVRRPTLDEAFLHLTGQGAGDNAGALPARALATETVL